jgi:hypothetical protein
MTIISHLYAQLYRPREPHWTDVNSVHFGENRGRFSQEKLFNAHECSAKLLISQFAKGNRCGSHSMGCPSLSTLVTSDAPLCFSIYFSMPFHSYPCSPPRHTIGAWRPSQKFLALRIVSQKQFPPSFYLPSIVSNCFTKQFPPLSTLPELFRIVPSNNSPRQPQEPCPHSSPRPRASA